MMNKSTFSKISKKIMRSQKGMRDPKLVHPQREWVTGILIALCILISAAAWSAVTYVRYQDVELSMGQNNETEVVVYRESLVNASLKIFAERQQRLELLMGGIEPLPADDEPEPAEETADLGEALPPLDTNDVNASSSTSTLSSEPENLPAEEANSTSSASETDSENQAPIGEPVSPSPAFEL